MPLRAADATNQGSREITVLCIEYVSIQANRSVEEMNPYPRRTILGPVSEAGASSDPARGGFHPSSAQVPT